jgi:hypothetical protein
VWREKVARSPQTAYGTVHELGPPNSLIENVSIPENLETQLGQHEVADLIAYLQAVAAPK